MTNVAYFNERTIIAFSQVHILLLSFITAIVPLFLISYLISSIPISTQILPRQKGALAMGIIVIFGVIFFINYKLIQLGIKMVTVDRLRKKMKWDKAISKEFWQSFKEAGRYTIKQENMPVKTILDWRLAICRDYARLIASLLYNLFPDKELYFIDMPGHVVAGIKLDNEIYILDPHYDNSTPPSVLKLNEWLIKEELNAENFLSEKKDSIFTVLIYS
jgi:hypothetical protein